MKKTASILLAATLATSAVAATASGAAAHPRHHHHHHHHHSDSGASLAAGLFFGLAAGAIVHSVTAPPAYYPPPAYHPPPTYPRYRSPLPARTHHSDWCAATYVNYDHATNTWIDGYGVRQPCFSPY